MSTPVVKSEQSGAPKEPKTIRPFKKIDGTLQHEVNTDMDLLLKEIAKVMEIEGAKGSVASPIPVESPLEEDVSLTRATPTEQLQPADDKRQKSEGPNALPKKFKCDLPDCDRAFAQKAQKISHMNSHNGIKKYVRLALSSTLPSTMFTQELTDGQRCDECGVCVSQAGNLQVSLYPKRALLSTERGVNTPRHLFQI